MIPLQVQGNKLLSLVINLYNAHWSSLGGTQIFIFSFLVVRQHFSVYLVVRNRQKVGNP
jgi:hypothetical protein